jgi:hypothetical protein
MPGSITPDGARAEIVENALVVGNPVKTAAKLKALASYLLYSDSNSDFASSAITASKPVSTDRRVSFCSPGRCYRSRDNSSTP